MNGISLCSDSGLFPGMKSLEMGMDWIDSNCFFFCVLYIFNEVNIKIIRYIRRKVRKLQYYFDIVECLRITANQKIWIRLKMGGILIYFILYFCYFIFYTFFFFRQYIFFLYILNFFLYTFYVFLPLFSSSWSFYWVFIFPMYKLRVNELIISGSDAYLPLSFSLTDVSISTKLITN